jgi:type II secretory pathway component GspD/PulD (secretin)
VYRLNRPATDTNRVLQQLFGLEGGLHKSAATTVKGPAGSDVAIVPSIIDNSLVISGPPEAVDEIRTLLEKLDQPRGMLLLEMEMGVVPFGEAKPVESPKPEEKTSAVTDKSFRLLQRPAKMETTAHARLITLDNQPAFIQMGSRVPRVTSMSVSSSSGGETRSVTMSNVGLLVGITPRIGLDGAVTMQIDVERSQLGIEKEGIPISVAEGKVIRSPRIDATTVQGTVRIPDAQTVVLGSVAQKGKSDEELVIVITPHIIRPEGVKKAR